jgi:hypothetical protein
MPKDIHPLPNDLGAYVSALGVEDRAKLHTSHEC